MWSIQQQNCTVGLNRLNSQLMAIISVNRSGSNMGTDRDLCDSSSTVQYSTVTVNCYGCHEYSSQIGQTFIQKEISFQKAVPLFIQKIFMIEHIFTILLLTEHWAISS